MWPAESKLLFLLDHIYRSATEQTPQEKQEAAKFEKEEAELLAMQLEIKRQSPEAVRQRELAMLRQRELAMLAQSAPMYKIYRITTKNPAKTVVLFVSLSNTECENLGGAAGACGDKPKKHNPTPMEKSLKDSLRSAAASTRAAQRPADENAQREAEEKAEKWESQISINYKWQSDQGLLTIDVVSDNGDGVYSDQEIKEAVKIIIEKDPKVANATVESVVSDKTAKVLWNEEARGNLDKINAHFLQHQSKNPQKGGQFRMGSKLKKKVAIKMKE